MLVIVIFIFSQTTAEPLSSAVSVIVRPALLTAIPIGKPVTFRTVHAHDISSPSTRPRTYFFAKMLLIAEKPSPLPLVAAEKDGTSRSVRFR